MTARILVKERDDEEISDMFIMNHIEFVPRIGEYIVVDNEDITLTVKVESITWFLNKKYVEILGII